MNPRRHRRQVERHADAEEEQPEQDRAKRLDVGLALQRARSCESQSFEARGERIDFVLRANAFLHHMVRNIVGSLIQVGSGNRPAGWIAELLAARDRELAAPTFSPDGLYLAKVDYDARWQLPAQQDSLPFL